MYGLGVKYRLYKRECLIQIRHPPDAPAREPEPALADLLARYDEPDPALGQITAQIAAPVVEAAILKRYGAAPANTHASLSVLYQTISQALLKRLFADT